MLEEERAERHVVGKHESLQHKAGCDKRKQQCKIAVKKCVEKQETIKKALHEKKKGDVNRQG